MCTGSLETDLLLSGPPAQDMEMNGLQWCLTCYETGVAEICIIH